MTLVLTRTLELRKQSEGLYGWIDNPSKYGCMDHFMRDTYSPNSPVSKKLRDQAWTSIGSTLKAPVFDSGDVTISSSRSATISDAELTSSLVTFTFVTYSWGFTQVPSDFHNNEFDMQQNFNQQYIRYLNKFHAAVDLACATKLSDGKTQVFGTAPADFGYTNVGNVVEAAYADREKVIGDLEALHAGNDVYGADVLIGNPGFMSLTNQMKEKATYNEVNKMIQLNGKTLRFSNRIANDADMYATFYSVPMGVCGMLFRVEREAIYQPRTAIGYEWGQDTLLGSGIPVGTYNYESAGDQSARTGAASADNTRAWKQHFGWSVDICYVTTHNTDPATYRNPIIKAQVHKA